MESNFSIEEILKAVDELRKTKKKQVINKVEANSNKNISDIPINTLKIIKEAEKVKS